jgi:hypothetical protein
MNLGAQSRSELEDDSPCSQFTDIKHSGRKLRQSALPDARYHRILVSKEGRHADRDHIVISALEAAIGAGRRPAAEEVRPVSRPAYGTRARHS